MTDKNCAMCGQRFTQRRVGSLYCSKVCKQKAWVERQSKSVQQEQAKPQTLAARLNAQLADQRAVKTKVVPTGITCPGCGAHIVLQTSLGPPFGIAPKGGPSLG